ncbi:TVP38/TMEM64 family protein [Paenibacillus terrigena]|uniref:TVP38/TMEM64 family protein n=1 Tax=Paenibacillus terrigena TaxID=369333 RepID=UPI0028D63180|nr:TVP38/TMEM64 family protein [Paenibacillus terrigena]
MANWIEHTYHYLSQLDMNQIEGLLDKYSSLGPLPGILLPFAEAFLPFLPLFIIVVGNASAYGLGLGFLYSWVGSVLGALILFLLARRFGGRFNDYLSHKYPKAEHFFSWVERRGFTPLFILYCFPFTPSFFINVASGMSRVPLAIFLASVGLGKAVMIFMMSFVGHDWQGFITEPWRIFALIIGLAVLWLGGKRIEKRFQIN